MHGLYITPNITRHVFPLDPSDWSRSDVARWLRWTMIQNGIATDSPHAAAAIEDWSMMGGQAFANLTEQNITLRFPQRVRGKKRKLIMS